MAVEYPYTTEARVLLLAGQLGVDLRLDDADESDDYADAMSWAIDAGTVEVDGYCQQYSQADLAASAWVMTHADYFALRALCQRRLNDVPESLAKECERREKQLMLVLQRKFPVPRVAKSRRPVAVTNYNVDLRKYNNTIGVDKTRSTGVAQDYKRPVDDTVVDER